MKRWVQFTVLALALAAAAGCAKKTGKKTDAPLTETDGILPTRLENFNPDTDVDYQTLKPYTIYFAFDSTTIGADQRTKLDAVSEWLQNHPGKMLFLAGHTDDRGTLEYNRGLAERRAQAVRDYLIGLGVNPSELHTISYGEERPAAVGHTESDHARNRRVQVGVIIPR